MPLSLVQYGVNLYAMNALGQTWMQNLVTLGTFRGPPLVLVNPIINDPTDAALVAVADFADYWNAPLVGFDTTVTTPNWAWMTLYNACLANAKFFTMPKMGTFGHPYAPPNDKTDLAFTGPWIALEASGNQTTKDAWAVLNTAPFNRTYQNHPYRCGMQGVSYFFQTSYGGIFSNAPLYGIASDGNVVGALSRLTKKWEADATPTVSQYEALYLAAALRPGLARLCNPALLPELVIATPV